MSSLSQFTGGGKAFKRTVITSGTGTHTLSAGVTRFRLTMCGGGGGMTGAGVAAGGGGATEFIEVPVGSVTAFAYVVGAHGASATAGSASTFGQWKANGGGPSTSGTVGGVGGVALYPGGISGGDGGTASVAGKGPANVAGLGGAIAGGAGGGGSSALGVGGAGQASGVGLSGTGYGSAAGAVVSGSSGTGPNGVIIVEEYL